MKRLRAPGQLLLALAVLVVLTASMLTFRDRLDKAHVALLYLLIVLGSSAAGRVAGLTVGVAAFALFDAYFLPPFNTLVVKDPLDWLVLVAFMVTSIVATELLNRQRVQAELAERRRSELDQLATLGAETLNAARAETALSSIARVIQQSVGVARCDLFVGTGADTLRAIASTAPTVSCGTLDYIAADGREAFMRRDSAVHVVSDAEGPVRTLDGGISAYAMPLTVRGNTVGVLQVSDSPELKLDHDGMRVLSALAYYAALALDRLRLEAAEETAEQLRRADRLKDSLLAAVSHDLRTPLTTIKGLAHEIAQQGSESAGIIESEADELSKMVDGLLELSQLQAQAMPMKREINTVDELLEAALQRAAKVLENHQVIVTQPDDTLLAGYFDFTHSLRILVNLLENAAKYSAQHETIEVQAIQVDAHLRITVSDRGVGVPDADLERLFEPFYRARNARPDVRGAGLGLSIARQMAEAQDGSLMVQSREGGGSVFTLTLPAAEIKVLE